MLSKSNLKNIISSKIKILKCNKCNCIPYFKFYNKNEGCISPNIFIKCKCKEIDSTNMDDLKTFYLSIDITPQNYKKLITNNILNKKNYEKIKNNFEKAKEKIYIKLIKIKEKFIKELNYKKNEIEIAYKNNFILNKKILDIIQILFNTYENYSFENENDLKIILKNIINNTNFNLSFKNNYNKNFKEYFLNNIIIDINDIIYNLENTKTYNLFKSFEDYKIILLSNKKLFAIHLNHGNGEHYLILNPKNNFKIEYSKKIDNFINVDNFFEIEKEKIFFYATYNNDCCILNLKNGDITKFDSGYYSFINLNNGNIFGFHGNKILLMDQKGKELKYKYYVNPTYHIISGLMLWNNYLFILKSNYENNMYMGYLSLIDINTLNDIKNNKFIEVDYFKREIKEIKNFDKKIIIIKCSDIYIINNDLCIETVIYNEMPISNILFNGKSYFLIDFYRGILIKNKTCKITYYNIPNILVNDNEKEYNSYDIEHSLENISIILYEGYIFIKYLNKILVFNFPEI